MSIVTGEELKARLFEQLKARGAVLVGAGDLTGVVDNEQTIGVSVAVPVPKNIVEQLKTAPTKEYYEMYGILNRQLNQIVEFGAEFLRLQGYHAHANTTDVVNIDENWSTALPHKTVAVRAGLGWIGKNCLLITESYGGAIRLSSFITDAPLPTDLPVTESKCGNCQECVRKCPAKALTGVNWRAGMKRENLFRKEICKKVQTERVIKATGIHTDMCGLCFAVCPYTQKYLDS